MTKKTHKNWPNKQHTKEIKFDENKISLENLRKKNGGKKVSADQTFKWIRCSLRSGVPTRRRLHLAGRRKIWAQKREKAELRGEDQVGMSQSS